MSKFKTNQTLISTGFNQPYGQTLTLSGNTLIADSGTIRYLNDMSSTYVARSLVDADYVTGITSPIINIGSNQQIIYRDVSGITGATNFLYNKFTSGVTLHNLCISNSPITDTNTEWLLSWDSGTSQVKKINYTNATGLNGAVNGLSTINSCAILGGQLINDTTINGSNIHSLKLCNLCNACIITTANNIVLDSRNNTGGIYLKSQSGATYSPVNNFNNSVGIGIDYPSNIFKIYDNRIGANQKGIEYECNYSNFYSPRSLVDKSYVDTIASGFHSKQSVQVATTDDITLSGDSQLIDGISILDVIATGNRILVKDQINQTENGVYSASTGVWNRTSDFDFNPNTGEVIQGSYFFVMSGNTNKSTTWVLTTPDIITEDVDPIIFNIFSQITNINSGTGITININNGEHTISVDGINLVGNSLAWNGTTCNFDVNINSGTLSTALNQTITGGTNYGIGIPVYSGSSDRNLQFNTITGSGGTTVQKIGNEIIINSATASDGQEYLGETPSAVDLCGIYVGYELTGKTVSCIIQDLLVPELCGNITEPSITIDLAYSGILEIGHNISQIVTANFNRGCINPQYCSVSDKRSGLPNAYCFTGSDMPIGFQLCTSTIASENILSYNVSSGIQTWGVCARYDAGNPALGSKGTEYCAALSSGYTALVTSSIRGILPWYWGTNLTNTITSDIINSGNKKVAVVTQSTPICFNATTEYLWFAAPAGTTTKTKWWVCAANAGDIGGTGNLWANACSVNVTSAEGCWSNCSYDVYVTCGITTTATGIPMCLYY